MSTQDINLQCNFWVNGRGEYGCTLIDIEVIDPSANVIITGSHIGERTNDDVNFIRLYNSNTPFIINEFFSTFPNLFELEIENSRLETLRIPGNAKLERLILFRNNISRIDGESLRNQTNLQYLRANNNGIQEIDEDAFLDLSSLWFMMMVNNYIREIAPKTLHPLTNAIYFDFEGNELSTLGDHIFANNLLLTTLYLERNFIRTISPSFTSDLRRSEMAYITLRQNSCISRDFSVHDEFDWMVLNIALQSCFTNFDDSNENRRLTIGFVGNLTLFDQFGNVIARL